MRSTMIGLLGLLAFSGVASAQTFTIDRAEWQTSDGGRLRVEGNGRDGSTVTISNAVSGAPLGTTSVDDDEWDRRFRNLNPVPCRVRASDGTTTLERNVSNAPANCGPVAGAQRSLAINDVTVTEGGTANFTVSLSAASTQTVTVVASTANGSATAGSDYTARSNVTLTFAPGTTTQTFAVATINDTAVESAETFNVNLTAATNATIADAQGVGTINDNDVQQQASLSINDVTVTEGGTANFTVTRSGNTTTAVSVVASTANGTAVAPGDFTARSSVTLNFAAGVTTQSFAVTTINDTAVESTETFTVNLSGATNATIADAQGVGTINDNDVAQQASLSINDVTVTEGGTANFTVTRSGNTTTAVSVIASTANGTAVAPGDFTALSNVTLNFAAGVTTQSFAVTTINDTAAEATETFNVNLSGATNATIADAQGVGTINDNDAVQNPTLSISDVTVVEGAVANFTVTRSGNTTTAVSVVASTANGTAVAPGDFTARANVTLNFAAGVTSQTFAVTTINDTAAEQTETFNVNLTGAVNATIADAQGVGTLTDNDTGTANCNPTANGNHNGCFTNQLTGAREYTGPGQCVACHEADARSMHSSVHYQQNGPTDFVTNIAGNAGEGPAGKPSGVNAVIGINTYCGTHENSPRFTCAGCHVGNGRFPKTPAELAALPVNDQRLELANIDCLTCHQQVYKRFPDWTATSEGFSDLVLQNVALDAAGALVPSLGSSVTRTGFNGIPNVNALTLDFQFRPSGAAGSVVPLPAGVPLGPMTLTTEVAAETLHRTPTRQSCLNCHAGAAGANGAKRGDLSTANVASTDLTLDRHMATNGSNLTCASCHNVDDTPTINDTGRQTTHHVRGRGLDLRANDHATRFTCDNAGCHNAATVHSAVTNGATFTTHANKVACQTCHIPRYGKGVATEMVRDWQKPVLTQTACNGRGGWLPEDQKSSTATPPVPITPTYQWFDGTSQIYYLTETLTNTPRKALPANIATFLGMPTTTQAYVMGRPNGGPGVAAAKIYPMKEHWGKLARNVSVNNPEVPVNSLVPQSTFEFFRTGSFCRAVAVGMGQNPDLVCNGAQSTAAPAGTEVVAVHTYQTLNHGVEPQANALGVGNTCGSCHDVPISPFTTGKPLRMNLQRDMGYAVTRAGLTESTPGNWSCSPSCHGNETGNFANIHSRSNHRNAGCNACHSAITGR